MVHRLSLTRFPPSECFPSSAHGGETPLNGCDKRHRMLLTRMSQGQLAIVAVSGELCCLSRQHEAAVDDKQLARDMP